eukprot:TRINITY_DN1435_c0_g1_i1.p2 TRINITY_DN1435_c0_g1~~TRINITY_DN1435_c0_g1_i1.p2  ORF type:complete len:563 (+),score=151.00 TRINITY_DN1435_c0_g1_i1:75-1763(+)
MAFVSSLRTLATTVVLACTTLSGVAEANKHAFLGNRAYHLTKEDFRTALGAVMGCGGAVEHEHLAEIESKLMPMWSVLPKNDDAKVEWRMVRFLAHRYFMKESSLLVRGFEPMRQINASEPGAPTMMGDQLPSLEQHGAQGFSLHDVAAMVAALEQLIRESEAGLLEIVYNQKSRAVSDSLSHEELSNILESYMVQWMIDEDPAVIIMLLRNQTLRDEALPKWRDIRKFLEGTLTSLEFKRRHTPSLGGGALALGGKYSFEEAQEAVGGVTKKFASFWENECQVIKDSLVAFDKAGTGRIALSDFYGANADGEWRFGESESYLRELGALDESSSAKGKQVIIPNYLQGASNCIVATSHYLICCVNECEPVLNEIEAAVGGPIASPEQILDLVANMTGLDDEAPTIDANLRRQLAGISETHGGHVPLHGRLFAQWLHYVFPRDCAFPHKAGVASAVTPSQFGDSFVASEDEVNGYAANRNETTSYVTLDQQEETAYMSQWSEEEELLADYSKQMQAPWDKKDSAMLLVMGVLVPIGFAFVWFDSKQARSKEVPMPFDSKAHYV